MSKGFSEHAVKGVSWNLIEAVSVYASRFVIGVILARLLFPADFGLIGMITIFISISDVFVNAGFGQAFIQKKDADDKDASTVFIINLLLGVIVYLILFLGAPFIADFFRQPKLVPLVRVLSLVVIINSMNVIQHSVIRKKFQFRKRAILTIIATLVSGTIGIVSAYIGYGVWSLVIQQLSNRVILCLLLYMKSDWKLSLSYSRDSAESLFAVGGWMLGGNLVLTLFNNLYRFVIGKLYSDVQLGLYERAKQFESMVADTFTMVLGNVSFPVFSGMQESSEELKRATSSFIRYSCILIYPVLSCIVVVAQPFICWIITDKWLMAVPYLKLLCIVGFIVPVNFFIGQLMQAVGKAKAAFHYTIGLSLLRVLNVVASYRFGVQGIIIGEGVVLVIATLIMSPVIRKSVGFSYLSCIKGILGLSLFTVVAIAAGTYILELLRNQNNIIQTILPSVSILAMFGCRMLIFEKNMIERAISILKK